MLLTRCKFPSFHAVLWRSSHSPPSSCRHVFSCCFSGRSTMSRDQALALMQEGLIFMRLEAGRVPIPVWLSLEDNNSVLSWRSCGTPTPPPPHSLSVALFNGARALESSDAQAKLLRPLANAIIARIPRIALQSASTRLCSGPRSVRCRRCCPGARATNDVHFFLKKRLMPVRCRRCWSSLRSQSCWRRRRTTQLWSGCVRWMFSWRKLCPQCARRHPQPQDRMPLPSNCVLTNLSSHSGFRSRQLRRG